MTQFKTLHQFCIIITAIIPERVSLAESKLAYRCARLYHDLIDVSSPELPVLQPLQNDSPFNRTPSLVELTKDFILGFHANQVTDLADHGTADFIAAVGRDDRKVVAKADETSP